MSRPLRWAISGKGISPLLDSQNVRRLAGAAVVIACGCASFAAMAAGKSSAFPGVELKVTGSGTAEVASALRVLMLLTLLSVIPAILIATTSFVRILVVLSMLRHAIGMQDTPPGTVLVTLALFLTFFTMAPVGSQVYSAGIEPFLAGKVGTEQAWKEGVKPVRAHMMRQTREQDLALMIEVAGAAPPQEPDDVNLIHLVPAYMLSELRIAFQIGFAIFLPFLLIDLVVSSVLMSLGMMMMPPTVVSLPFKILMFVLIDGWNLVVRALLATFA